MSESQPGPIPVVVTGVGGGGIGEQIIKALRLADNRYEIIGCDAARYSLGFTLVDHPYLVPRATDAEYIPTMLSIAARHNARAVFVGSEPELQALSRGRDLFINAGILLPMSPAEVIDTCLDKKRTITFLSERGFHTPRTIQIATIDDLEGVPFFPAVLKPSIGGRGSADVVIAQDRDELIAFGRYLLANGRRILAQEYVGTPDSEYTVGILADMDGEVLGSIAVKRLITSGLGLRSQVSNRTGRRSLGSNLVISSGISQGEIGPFPDVTVQCEKIAKELGCRGPINIQCRLVDSAVVVFEINPRFSGTTSLRALVGFNEPDLLVRSHLLGEQVTPVQYRSAMVLRGLHEAVVDARDSLTPGLSDRV
jgi:carbamoyl-phosphate synthase large subunit